MNTELKGCRSGTQFTPIVHTARSAATDTNKLSFPRRVNYQMPIACDAMLWCSMSSRATSDSSPTADHEIAITAGF
jgi:hypothetical protein